MGSLKLLLPEFPTADPFLVLGTAEIGGRAVTEEHRNWWTVFSRNIQNAPWRIRGQAPQKLRVVQTPRQILRVGFLSALEATFWAPQRKTGPGAGEPP